MPRVRHVGIGTKLMGWSPAWLVAIGMLTGYFALLLALGGHEAWDELGVPPFTPGFLDLRSLTSGWDCAREGLGEWPDNPCDPLGRPENYPRIWIAASVLGLGQDDTYLIGSVLVVTFFAASIVVLPRQAPVGHAVVYGFALSSPAVMLGVERGNVDLALFGLVVAAGLVMRHTPYGAPAASALVLVAAILKLFPIAAVIMLAGLPRRAAVINVASVTGIFTAYAAATFDDIQTINEVLPQTDDFTYGLHIFGAWLGRLAGDGRVWDVFIIALTLGAAIATRRRLRERLQVGATQELDHFRAGAGIYIATFALGRSSDYRLVFVLLTIPLLVRWASGGQIVAIATLVGVLVTLWLPSGWEASPILDAIIGEWNELTLADGRGLTIDAPAQVLAFIGLTCLLAATFERTPSVVSRDTATCRSATSRLEP